MYHEIFTLILLFTYVIYKQKKKLNVGVKLINDKRILNVLIIN